jgi:hypothetical protein
MKQQDFETSILIDKSPAEVYTAINNPRGWWQGTINGITDELHQEFTYEVAGIHFSRQKIVELQPERKVTWFVTESNLTFVDDHDEWTHTKIEFTIRPEGQKTRIIFKHIGLRPAFACYDGCSGAWGSLIEKSLQSYISTGTGVNVFNF